MSWSVFMFHPLMGWAVLGGVVALCGLAILTEMTLRGPTERSIEASNSRRAFADTMKRNAGLIQALGMHGVMSERWDFANGGCRREQLRSADIACTFGSLLRSFRMLLQSALLALGAYLVINQQATAGVMLAATILTVRALSPVELLIANWKSFIAARQSYRRLGSALAAMPKEDERTPLPAPRRNLRFTSVSLLAAGRESPVIHDVSFAIDAGSALGIIGSSGSGKSSLARAVVGLWPPARGVIRLDGANLEQWGVDVLGSAIGYLPQDVELLPGSVAENIARFRKEDPRKLLAAAEAAGVHDLVLRLPDGYETQVGEGGALLSGGQRQRIALARALYGDPFLVVLDEPNSNLDAEGEAALTKAIQSVRLRGGVAVVIAHRPSALAAVDKLLIVNSGTVQAFGARDAVLQQLGAPAPAPPAPVPAPMPVQAQTKARKPKAQARRPPPPARQTRVAQAPEHQAPPTHTATTVKTKGAPTYVDVAE